MSVRKNISAANYYTNYVRSCRRKQQRANVYLLQLCYHSHDDA